jgi:bifunctional non-homologous end joining protein LigD
MRAADRTAKRSARQPDAAAQSEPGTLRDYAQKRAFEATPEPRPQPVSQRRGPLLFVVQQHSARRLHYDFRLELDGVLKSWAVPDGPSADPKIKRLAVPVEDHPFDYASFEGVIPPKQYGAGEVIVWDCGLYSPDEGKSYAFDDRDEAQRRLQAEYEKGKLSIFLLGEKLKGSWTLVRMKDKDWLLIKHKDQFARSDLDVRSRANSVLSGYAVGDLKSPKRLQRLSAERLIPNGPPETAPPKLAPMLAASADAPFSDPAFLYEPKLDGYRCLAFRRDDTVRLLSRRGLDQSAQFPEIVAALQDQVLDDLVVDGEIVAHDQSGRPSFNALQNRAQLKNEHEIAAAQASAPCVLYAFDVLHVCGMNLRGADYQSRKRYLAQCVVPSQHLQILPATDAPGEKFYAAALEAGFEGAVAKKRDGRYEAGVRSPAWLKIKATQSGEFLVCGYTVGKGQRAKTFGALYLGYRDPSGQIVPAGRVGSGFDESSLDDLAARLKVLETTRHPFAREPDVDVPVVWLKPELVAEIQFAAWTADGSLRAPVFLRLRDDIPQDEASVPQVVHVTDNRSAASTGQAGDAIRQILEQLQGASRDDMTLHVGSEQLRLTHLNKVLWPKQPKLKQPAVSKRDLLIYLARVSPYMLPHLADRPLTMIRFPDGITKHQFFQKHWEHKLPEFVETITVYSGSKQENGEYLLCNNLPTLIWLGQMGTLEYHVWHSRGSLYPDAQAFSTDFTDSAENIDSSILNFPDYVVFDIDPYIYSGKEAPGAEPELNTNAFEKGKEVAFWLKELLERLGLQSPVVKTSGKTGLHIFVPIKRNLNFTAARQICETIGRYLMQEHPDVITLEWSIEKRTGKIFIDSNMNVRGKTLNSAYSPRALPGAPVSMPVTWEELASAHPMEFRMWNVFERLERQGDVWHNVIELKADLHRAFG